MAEKENYSISSLDLSQMELYLASLRNQNNVLLKAIRSGIYDSRSVVGDSQIRINSALNQLEEILEKVKNQA